MCNCKEWYTVSTGRGANLLIRDGGGERRLLNGPTRQKHFQDKE